MKRFLMAIICTFLVLAHLDLGHANCHWTLENLNNPAAEGRRVELLRFISTPTAGSLRSLLSSLLPHGQLRGKSSDGEESVLHFNTNGGTQTIWAEIRIFDPATFVQNSWGGGHYKKSANFGIVTSETDSENIEQKKDPGIDGAYAEIVSAGFEKGVLKVLLKRNSKAIAWDKDFKYQELTMVFDKHYWPKSVKVRSGSSPLTNFFWNEMEIELPENKLLKTEDPRYGW